jgi:hypothetical protein
MVPNAFIYSNLDHMGTSCHRTVEKWEFRYGTILNVVIIIKCFLQSQVMACITFSAWPLLFLLSPVLLELDCD